MTAFNQSDGASTVFGLSAVQMPSERDELQDVLTKLWNLTYQRPLGKLSADLEACRVFFDPVARGHKLRERLANLQPVPPSLWKQAARIPEPVIIDVGNNRLLVGVEARLLLELLYEFTDETGGAIIPVSAVLDAERRALATYRAWARHRLDQVIALQTGRGEEVMQATSVGVVLALLVNRSTSPDRAIGRLPDRQIQQWLDEAIHAAANAFANTVTFGRQRSQHEQRLVGGFPLTEARRRLADRLVVTPARRGEPSSVYIPPGREGEVLAFLARDLARRDGLTKTTLAKGYDNLVAAFRHSSAQLASHGMIFERPADTVRLRQQLLDLFESARTFVSLNVPN